MLAGFDEHREAEFIGELAAGAPGSSRARRRPGIAPAGSRRRSAPASPSPCPSRPPSRARRRRRRERLASSTRPCTVPSSPIGPWRSGMTTVVAGSLGRRRQQRGRRHLGPARVESSREVVGPASSAAAAASAIAHRPSVEIPTGVIRYFAGSAAASTCAAVVHDTSCSADSPPNSTIRLIRSSGSRGVAVGIAIECCIPVPVMSATVPFGCMKMLASEAAAGDRRPSAGPGHRVRGSVVRHPLARSRSTVRARRRGAQRARVHRGCLCRRCCAPPDERARPVPA